MKIKIDTVEKNDQSKISDNINNDSFLENKTNLKLSFIEDNLVLNTDNEEVLKKSYEHNIDLDIDVNIIGDTNKKNKNYVIKNNVKVKKNQLIFNIKKIKKLGRIKKNSTKKGKHNKMTKDNVIRRFKVQLITHIFNYINSLFNINNYGKSKKQINVIKKVDSIYIKTISKEENIEWLNSKLNFIFSKTISSKLSNFDINYNKKLIQRIYSKNEEKKVINILDKTIREMLSIYCNDDPENKYPGFKTLKDDLIRLRELKEDEAYIEMYSLVAISFEEIYEKIIPIKKK